jgi:hypothetical protein
LKIQQIVFPLARTQPLLLLLRPKEKLKTFMFLLLLPRESENLAPPRQVPNFIASVVCA